MNIRKQNMKRFIILTTLLLAVVISISAQETALDPDSFIIGMNLNLVGAIPYSSGHSIGIELGKGNLNCEINATFPYSIDSGGFGSLLTVNYFGHSRIGGFYAGGGVGFSNFQKDRISITAGLNTGYKFITRSGLYFRTGGFVGYNFAGMLNLPDYNTFPIYFKPDIAVGVTKINSNTNGDTSQSQTRVSNANRERTPQQRRGGTVDPGALTITGIPEEFNGKFALSEIWSIPDYTRVLSGSSRVANGEGTVIANGEVKIPITVPRVFGKPNGYDGSDILDIRLKISDTREAGLIQAVLASVQFENGIAEVNWDNAIRPGIITVTNIPEHYHSFEAISGKFGRAEIRVGQTTRVVADMVPAGIPNGSGSVVNGTVTMAVLRDRDASGYESFPENTQIDFLLLIHLPRPKNTAITITQFDHYLFRNVQIINGKATIDFRRGAKQ